MKKFIIAIIMLIIATPSFAINVNEIIKKAEQASYYQGKDGKAKVDMHISDGRRRQFVVLRKNFDKDQKFYIYFNRPNDVRKTAFLVHKYQDKVDDRWMFLPALDLVKRIASGDKRTSFVGSNFFYEDISGRNIADDNHKLLETTDNYYVVESAPKDLNSVEFKYYKSWIHKTSFIPVKVSYFDKSDVEYRQYEAKRIETIDGYQTVVEAEMRDLYDNTNTKISYSAVKYNQYLEENIFTERFLKAPPRNLLK